MSQVETRDFRPEPRTNTMGGKMSKATEKTKHLFSSGHICRVPKHLRKVNKSAYTPRLFAIGPLHKKDPHLQTHMQDVKMYYADYLLYRVNKEKEDSKTEKLMLLQKCMKKLGEKVDEAKKYYTEELDLSDEELVEMMLVDGCFILEVLYNYYDPPKKSEEKGGDSGNFILKLLHRCYPKSNGGGSGNSDEEERETTNRADSGNSKALSSNPQLIGRKGSSGQDPVLDNVRTNNILKLDLLLFENQIPFFVLKDLFELTLAKIPSDQNTENTEPSLTDYVLSYFGNILFPEGENSCSKTRTSCCSPCDCVLQVWGSSKKSDHIEKEYGHILHILHKHYGPGNEGEYNQNSFKTSLPTATDLVSASDLNFGGVKFAPGKTKNLFDVRFVKHEGIRWWIRRVRFEIPTLKIDDFTETILRNLIALEQCCPGVSQHFTSYASFMNKLINTEKDVEVIRKAKVTLSYLGADKDVSDLFNNLSKEVVIGPEFYFQDQYHHAALSEYSNRWWPKIMAYWARTYFASPWQFVAFCAGITACSIGVAQFIRSFLK